MDTIIVRNVVVTANDYLAVTTQLTNTSPGAKRTKKWMFGILIVSLIGVLVNYWESGPRMVTNSSFFVILALVSYGYLFFGNILLRQYLLRAYTANKFPAKYSTDYTFTADNLSGYNKLSDFTTKWAAIQRTAISGHWLLLYLTNRSCYWIDLHKLEAPATLADLQNLLATQHIAARLI